MTEQNVSTIYDSMWNQSTKEFEKNKFEFDRFLNHPNEDKRTGISLIGKLKDDVLIKILNFIKECESVEPDQFFYHVENIHVTILSIISCVDTFNLTQIDKGKYIEIIREAVKSINPFKILFKGITASPSCVMVQGFPMDNNLHMLRNELRNRFNSSNLNHSMDKRYTLKTAHSTIIRFKNPLRNHEAFIELLNRYRDVEFGMVEFDQVEFVYNDWYMTSSLVKTLKTFGLRKMN